MAKVQTYDQKYLPTTQISQVTSLPGEKRNPVPVADTSKKWANITNFAETVTKIDKRLKDARDVEAYFDASDQFSSETSKLINYMISPEYRKTHKYQDDFDYYKDHITSIKDRILGKLDVTEKGRKDIETKFNQLELHYNSVVRKNSHDAEISEMQAKVPVRLQNYSDGIILADENGDTKGAMLKYTEAKSYITGKIADRTITPKVGLAYENWFDRAVFGTIYNRKIRSDPKGALEELSKPIKNMPEPLREDLKYSASRELEKRESKIKRENYIQRDITTKRMEASLTLIGDTGEGIPGVEKEIINTFGDKAPMILNRYNEQKKIKREQFLVLKKIDGMSKIEAVNFVNTLAPTNKTKKDRENYKINKDLYQVALKRLEDKKQILSTDPVKYVKSNDLGLTPITEDMSSDEIISTLEMNNDKIISEQVRQGVDPKEALLLTSEEADAVVNKLSNMTLDDQVKMLRSLSQQYGKHWDRLEDQLVDHHLSEGSRLAIQCKNQHMAHVYLTAEQTPEKKFKDVLGDEYNEVNKDITARVDEKTRDYFRCRIKEIGSSPKSLDRLGLMPNIIRKAAKTLVVFEGMSTKDAVDKAVDSIIDKNTIYTENYLIPGEYAGSADRIKFVLRNKRVNLDVKNLLKPYSNEEWSYSIPSNSFWTGNNKSGDEFGYYLKYNIPGNDPGSGPTILKDKNGKHIEMTIKQILKEPIDEEAFALRNNIKYRDSSWRKYGEGVMNQYKENQKNKTKVTKTKTKTKDNNIVTGNPYYQWYKSTYKND